MDKKLAGASVFAVACCAVALVAQSAWADQSDIGTADKAALEKVHASKPA